MNNYLGGTDAAGAQRATQAMLEMKKIDLAAMKRAYTGN
jgi:predicted 3-demethylubiquinone-9 3-methyltransferase (glyoxalase superfamily)